MKLEGSCHCGAVRFSVESAAPVPYLRCYCSVCRKTGGGGGYAINLGANRQSLVLVSGEAQLSWYDAFALGDLPAAAGDEPTGPAANPGTAGLWSRKGRCFCSRCGSMLWNYDPSWPELVHPFASAIDTPLPVAGQRVHIMLDSKASWVEPAPGVGDLQHAEYPEESLAEWHARQGEAG